MKFKTIFSTILFTVLSFSVFAQNPTVLLTETSEGNYLASLEFPSNPNNTNVAVSSTSLRLLIPTTLSITISNMGPFSFSIVGTTTGPDLNGFCGASATHDLLTIDDDASRNLANLSAGASIPLFTFSSTVNEASLFDHVNGCIAGGLGVNNTNYDPDGPDGVASSGIILQPTTVLPIVISSFDVNKSNDDAVLDWSTSSEINGSHFEIERSFDGQNWSYVNSVEAVGDSKQTQRYSYTDVDIAGDLEADQPIYYQIKMVDLDGSHEYTDVRSVNFSKDLLSTNMTVYPNPTSDQIQIDLKDVDSSKKYMLQFIDISGRVAHTKKLVQEKTQLSLAALGLGNGIYTAVLREDDQAVDHAKVVLLK